MMKLKDWDPEEQDNLAADTDTDTDIMSEASMKRLMILIQYLASRFLPLHLKHHYCQIKLVRKA